MKRIKTLFKVSSHIIILISFIGSLVGCYIRTPSIEDEYPNILKGERSLVIFRVTCELTGESGIGSTQGCLNPYGPLVSIAINDFETGGTLFSFIQVGSLSDYTFKMGWAYLILEPGIYYLNFEEPEIPGYYRSYEERIRLQPYRIDIEPNSAIVYVGTMHLQCYSSKIGPNHCCFIHNQVVENEEVVAQNLVIEYFYNMKPPKTALMKKHTGKTYIFGTPKPKR